MTELSRHHGHRAHRRRSPLRPAAPGRPGPVGPGRAGELSDAAEAAVRGYLERRPDATVVVLGEGLGTGFRRLDNGRLTWLSVLPPEDAAARRLLLPDGPRRRTVGCAGSGADWPDVVGAPEGGVVVAVPRTPAGLPAGAVRDLLAVCAARFPGGALVLDALPRWTAAVARSARRHPAVAAVRVLPLAAGRGSPGRWRRWLAGTVVCEVRFTAGGAT
ncbi:class I SAM-dependent methyltransferase [Streptomyces noursei]|uniref:class I SAM-dependent methyltransferase n=1 Tax=Streptomyces noursei TaxID=1971 RepID=UPI001963F25F|nr:class I SAM-dependent methyltransferase [Streptomyces noursei]QRX91867.1 class I SAM-dependent methyltransferase [Streptomyces noursei]